MIVNSYCRVTAAGAYLPEKKLLNADFEKIIETNDEWIVKRTGIRERAIAADDEYASDLAIKAVQKLVDENDNALDGVDMIIVTTFTADHLSPSIAAIVQGHFGINDVGTFDLHSSCSGFEYAYGVVNALISSGQCNKILLIASETISKVTDYTDRSTCILFGDAAVAFTVEKCAEPRLLISRFGTNGELADMVYCSGLSNSIIGKPVEKCQKVVQNGRSLYEYVVKNISSGFQSLLNEAKLKFDDIDWFVPHSANLRMIDAICDRIGFPHEKTLTSIEKHGNTSSVSIPLALWDAFKNGQLKRGQKLCLYGFGAGLTHAGIITEF